MAQSCVGTNREIVGFNIKAPPAPAPVSWELAAVVLGRRLATKWRRNAAVCHRRRDHRHCGHGGAQTASPTRPSTGGFPCGSLPIFVGRSSGRPCPGRGTMAGDLINHQYSQGRRGGHYARPVRNGIECRYLARPAPRGTSFANEIVSSCRLSRQLLLGSAWHSLSSVLVDARRWPIGRTPSRPFPSV